MSDKKQWDVRTDVIVVGFGFAGGVSAVAASDNGADVVLLEKMPFPGGLSITSGGGFAVAEEEEGVFQYLKHTNNNLTPDSVNRALAKGMTELPEYIRYLEDRSNVKFGEDARSKIDPGAHATYPFPGADKIRSMRVAPDPNFKGFPWTKGMRGGARLFKLLMNNVEARKIDIRYGTAAADLLYDQDGTITGVLATRKTGDGKTVELRILARKGVILACGGFENNDEMKKAYFGFEPLYYVVAEGNTGDGIRMAQKAGAKLWHMHHHHSGYGFKFPEFPNAFRQSISGPRVPTRKMPWILVDKYGRRFMNEYPPALQDTPVRSHIDQYDPERQEFPRIPCFMLFDEAGRKERAIAFPVFTGYGETYDWSADNSKEIERGWIHKAESVAQLAEQLNMEAGVLQETLNKWNEACETGDDAAFGRIGGTMMPVSTPPYYWVETWPVLNNTQGGPAHDEFQRVLNWEDKPIPRLYAAGECGSMFGHLYLEAGNVAECFVSGRLAGKDAAGLEPLDL